MKDLIHNSNHDGFPVLMQISHAVCRGGGGTLERRQLSENRFVPEVKHLCRNHF